MDVRLPNGTVIKGVPDGTTKAQLAEKLKGNGMDVPEDWLPKAPEPEKPGFGRKILDAGQAVASAVSSIPAGFAGTLGGVAGAGAQVLGAPEGTHQKWRQAATDAVQIPYPESMVVPGAAQAEAALGRGAAKLEENLPGSGSALQAAGDALNLIGMGSGAKALSPLTRLSRATPAELEALAKKGIPTEQALKEAKTVAYKKVSEAGLDTQADSLKASLQHIAAETEPGLHPKTAAVLGRIGAKEGTLTLDDVERLRQMAGEAQFGHTIEPGDSRRLGQIRSAIDDHVEAMASSDPATGQALLDARNLYSRYAKSSDLSDMVSRAYQKADSSPNLTRYNALQTELRKLSVSEKELRRFSPAEQDAIKQAAKATGPEAVLREIGRLAHLSPAGFLGSVGVLSGHGSAGIAVGTGTYLAGHAARKVGTALQKARVEKLGEMFRTGGKNAAPLERVPMPRGAPPLGYKALPAPGQASPSSFGEVPVDQFRVASQHPAAAPVSGVYPEPLTAGPMVAPPRAPAELMPVIEPDAVLTRGSTVGVRKQPTKQTRAVRVTRGEDVNSFTRIPRDASGSDRGGAMAMMLEGADSASRTLGKARKRTKKEWEKDRDRRRGRTD